MNGNFWDEKFSIGDYFYGKKANEFLQSISHLFKPESRILCIAEGEGRNAVFLAGLGHEVSCVDFSIMGKKKALALAQELGVKINYEISDLESYDFSNDRWDVIVSIFAHFPSAVRESIHNHVFAGLKPGGMLVIESYTLEQLKYKTGGPQDPSMLYSKTLLQSDFPKVQWQHLDEGIKTLSEGIGHQGLSHTLRGVGVKL